MGVYVQKLLPIGKCDPKKAWRSIRRNERRNRKEIRYGNTKRGGVRGRAGSESLCSTFIILQIFWNVVQFYS